MSTLKLEQISKKFGGNEVIRGLSLSLVAGKVYVLLGDNGAGKTTLLNIINGQIRSDKGKIYFNNDELTRKSTYQRSQLGIVRLWQHGKIFENMSVLDNLLVSRPSKGERLLDYLLLSKVMKAHKLSLNRAATVLEDLELTSKVNNLGKELSLGQQRLLSFGRILMHEELEQKNQKEKSLDFSFFGLRLIHKPQRESVEKDSKRPLLILADEPFSGVHEDLVTKIGAILRGLASEGHTVLMIEHNIKQAVDFADGILLLENGQITQQLITEEYEANMKILSNE